MKTIKRILPLLLIVILVLGMVPVGAFAAEDGTIPTEDPSGEITEAAPSPEAEATTPPEAPPADTGSEIPDGPAETPEVPETTTEPEATPPEETDPPATEETTSPQPEETAQPETEASPSPVPEVPPSGEELWQSLPPELLANVAEGKMEEIASLKSRIKRLEADLERVGEIQREKMENTAP